MSFYQIRSVYSIEDSDLVAYINNEAKHRTRKAPGMIKVIMTHQGMKYGLAWCLATRPSV